MRLIISIFVLMMILHYINAKHEIEDENLITIGEDSIIKYLQDKGFLRSYKNNGIEPEDEDYRVLEISPRIKSVLRRKL